MTKAFALREWSYRGGLVVVLPWDAIYLDWSYGFKVFASGLNSAITADELAEHMSMAGQVDWVQRYTPIYPGGTAVVAYHGYDEAQNAAAMLNGTEIGGSILVLTYPALQRGDRATILSIIRPGLKDGPCLGSDRPRSPVGRPATEPASALTSVPGL